jgi:hypothetical protein
MIVFVKTSTYDVPQTHPQLSKAKLNLQAQAKKT